MNTPHCSNDATHPVPVDLANYPPAAPAALYPVVAPESQPMVPAYQAAYEPAMEVAVVIPETAVEGVPDHVPASGLVVSQAVPTNSWTTPFFNCGDWRKVIVSAVCLPCVSVENESISDQWGQPKTYSPFTKRVAPVLVLDVLPCICFGTPIPLGSALTNIRNRRVYRDHYGIKGNFLADLASSLCLPCSNAQIANQAGEELTDSMILGQPILKARVVMD